MAKPTLLGLRTILNSTLDTHLLLFLRLTRFLAFSSSTLILASHFCYLGLTPSPIGFFLSVALLGDSVSFLLVLVADKLGRRKVLLVSNLLVAVSGAVLASVGRKGDGEWDATRWILMSVAVVGIVSPNGREIGPFGAVEESILAQLTGASERNDVFAWYTVLGSAGSSLGKLLTGLIVGWLIAAGKGELSSYRVVWWGYAIFGLGSAGVVCLLSEKVEFGGRKQEEGTDIEEETLLVVDDEFISPMVNDPGEKKPSHSLWPQISPESRPILFKLCFLFAIDSLASGLVPASWTTYFFTQKFSLTPSSLGTLFSLAAFLSAISSFLAAPLARRIGLIQTIVFTHLPSAIFLSLIPLSPSLPIAITFLLLRSSLASMDIAPKAVFISMVVLPEERTGVMGLVNVVRTASQSAGPWVMGWLGEGKGEGMWRGFVIVGCLKAGYDLGLLGAFWRGRVVRDRERNNTDGDEEEHDREL